MKIYNDVMLESRLGISLKKNLHYFDKDARLYKKNYSIETGRAMREKYESGLIRNEYAPYHFVDTEQEFQILVKGLRP